MVCLVLIRITDLSKISTDSRREEKKDPNIHPRSGRIPWFFTTLHIVSSLDRYDRIDNLECPSHCGKFITVSHLKDIPPCSYTSIAWQYSVECSSHCGLFSSTSHQVSTSGMTIWCRGERSLFDILSSLSITTHSSRVFSCQQLLGVRSF